MPIPSTPPRPFAPLFELERARLLELLATLDTDDWARPTPCPGWSVLGLAAHLLGGDLGLLAGQRDQHVGTPVPPGLTEHGFIAWIDELMDEWVHAARRLSPRLVVDLLAWTGPQVAELIEADDPAAWTAHVSWASRDPVPVWLDHARELSERWIHRQQLLEALGRPSDLRTDLGGPVLDGLRWAYPFRLEACPRAPGSAVTIEVAGPAVTVHWLLVSDSESWSFDPSPDGPTVAGLRATDEQAWRLLTNNHRPEQHGPVAFFGDPEIIRVLERTRAIIGEPQ
jgi:uncharacterized protein (TIGR03083 family)